MMIKEPLNASFRRSFPDSILQYFSFRLIASSIVPILIILGKNSMVMPSIIQPYGEVSCIDDAIIDLFLPACKYLNDNSTLGIILLTLGNLLLDGQLILSCVWWFIKIDNFRLPVGLTVLGVTKMLIAVTLCLTAGLISNARDPEHIQAFITSALDTQLGELSSRLFLQCAVWLHADRNFRVVSYGQQKARGTCTGQLHLRQYATPGVALKLLHGRLHRTGGSSLHLPAYQSLLGSTASNTHGTV
jgi:hypothetical protein